MFRFDQVLQLGQCPLPNGHPEPLKEPRFELVHAHTIGAQANEDNVSVAAVQRLEPLTGWQARGTMSRARGWVEENSFRGQTERCEDTSGGEPCSQAKGSYFPC